VGERSAGQVMTFSARPSSYLISPPENWLYGGVLQTRARPEGRLFPGTLITLLAMIGLLLRPPSHRLIVYLMALVAAFELSLGFGGHVYGWFYAHVPVFRGLRAASRLGIFVLLFLAVIGGHGYAALTSTWGKRAQVVFVAVLCAVFVIEYRVDLPLSREYPNTAPAVYRLLARQPRGVVAEFPVPLLNQLPGSDPQYTYCSTFHWFPLVNGYSGMYPRSYLQRMLRLRGFPDEASFRQLQFDDVRYIILHDWPGRLAAIEGLAQSDRFVLLGTFDDAGTATAYLYRARE